MNISKSCKVLGIGLVLAAVVAAVTPMAVVWAREAALDAGSFSLGGECAVSEQGVLSPARKGMARFLVTDINATSDEALKESALPVLKDAWVAQQEAVKEQAPGRVNVLYTEDTTKK